MTSDSPSKLIGEYLLKGWTLLGENCANGCNVPLMRSRDKSSLVCVSCGTDFLKAKPAAAVEVAPASKCDTKVPAISTPNLSAVLDAKIEWIMREIEVSKSVSDLSALVDLLSKFLTLRNSF